MNAASQPKDIIAGKYKLDRVLGEGGMGVVVMATHLHLDERVAVKFLHPDMMEEDGLKERFVREARVLSKIKSEHVVRVYDVDVLPSGLPYFVMEHLDGNDLAESVIAGGPLPVEAAVNFTLQACVGLAEAHARGIVHRDLKPSNLFVCTRSDGRPILKLIDFGISKDMAVAKAGLQATKTAEIRGSPFFMAPEQLRHPRDADVRVDIWSLGVTLYHLLTAHFPFEADNVMELSIKIFNDNPADLRAKRKDVPRALEEVIMRCLKKNAGERFADVGKLAAALSPFAPAEAEAYVMQAERILRGAERQSQASIRPANALDSRVSPNPPRERSEHRRGLSTTSAATSQLAKHSGRPTPPGSWQALLPGLSKTAALAFVVGVIVFILTIKALEWFSNPGAGRETAGPGQVENASIEQQAKHRSQFDTGPNVFPESGPSQVTAREVPSTMPSSGPSAGILAASASASSARKGKAPSAIPAASATSQPISPPKYEQRLGF